VPLTPACPSRPVTRARARTGVPAADALPLVQDALDSIEFITGEPNSTWGAVRASMGRHDPWPLNYVAIGNEDCGKPFYLENYLLFYGAIHARYPHMRLVANCDMGAAAPTDLWDWHVYASPTALFAQRREFDGRDPKAGHFVFASEYAVTDGGGWGNLIGRPAFHVALRCPARTARQSSALRSLLSFCACTAQARWPKPHS
jgi:alpha-N-arabinofuranosidase